MSINVRPWFGGKHGVRDAECGVWKMRSVENEECGKCGVWKMRSVENAGVWKVRSVENTECGKCGVWKMGSVENAECGKCRTFQFQYEITNNLIPLYSH